MANFTVIGLYFSLEIVIFAFYGKFPIRVRMSPYSTNDGKVKVYLLVLYGQRLNVQQFYKLI